MKTIRALRGFWYDGRLIQKGEVVQVPEGLANELVSSLKAEFIIEEEKADGTASENDSSART